MHGHQLEAAVEALDAAANTGKSAGAAPNAGALVGANTSADTEARIATCGCSSGMQAVCRPGEGGQLACSAQAALARVCGTRADAWCAHVFVEAVLACAGAKRRMSLRSDGVNAEGNVDLSASVLQQPRHGSAALVQALADAGLPGGHRCCRLPLHWQPPPIDVGADVWHDWVLVDGGDHRASGARDAATADVGFNVCKDANGAGLRFRFMLPPGGYATSLLREFMK